MSLENHALPVAPLTRGDLLVIAPTMAATAACFFFLNLLI